jgi:hypothetical protein
VDTHPALHHQGGDQELLLRNEYLSAENRILRAQLKDRFALADIGYRLGRKALAEVATAVQPATILLRYRRPVAHKLNGAPAPRAPGRPPIDRDIEELIVRMANENAAPCGEARSLPRQACRKIAAASVLRGLHHIYPAAA